MANNSMYFGEATEHLVVSKLLNEDREVYRPVVDDHGIDILVKSKAGASDDYQEIQVKSKASKGLFAGIKCPKPRRNYWFIFYVKARNEFWLINSVNFVKIASQNKKGLHAGTYSITITSKKAPAPVPNFNAIP